MKDVIDRLMAEREARLQEIEMHRGHIGSLEDAIAQLEGQVKGLEKALEIFQKEGLAPKENGQQKPPDRYALMTLTPALLDVIQREGEPPGLLPSEIATKLKEGGFQSNAENLYQSVYSVAMNQFKKGRIRECQKAGKRAFLRR